VLRKADHCDDYIVSQVVPVK